MVKALYVRVSSGYGYIYWLCWTRIITTSSISNTLRHTGLMCSMLYATRGLPKPPKPGTYREPGSVKFSKTRNRNLPGSPKTWQTSNRNLTRNRNQEFKALHLSLPRNLLVEPRILSKNQEVSQEVPGEVGTSCLTFPTMTSVTATYCKCFSK